MQDFTLLDVWQKSHALTLAVYRSTDCFPREETYGMRRQLRDAATSVESNIAEGCGRRTNGERYSCSVIAVFRARSHAHL